MAEGCGREPGGIEGVLSLCDEHGQALESDLIDKGLRLRWVGEPWFTWRDLIVIIRESKQDSALMRSMHPESYRWGQTEHLLADLLDLTNILVWFKTKDGQKGRNRPAPYPRPGVDQDAGKRRVKGSAVPMDQVHQRLRLVHGEAS